MLLHLVSLLPSHPTCCCAEKPKANPHTHRSTPATITNKDAVDNPSRQLRNNNKATLPLCSGGKESSWRLLLCGDDGAGGNGGNKGRRRRRTDSHDNNHSSNNNNNSSSSNDNNSRRRRSSLQRSLLAGSSCVCITLCAASSASSCTTSPSPSTPTVAIIIPALNEAASIGTTLRCLALLDPSAREVIVVDGGSVDGTIDVVRKHVGVDVVRSDRRGRAVQMNRGVAASDSDYVCFVHADTIVPQDLVAIIRKSLSNERTVLGGFISKMTVPGRTLWGITFHNWIKTYYGPLLLRPLSFLFGFRCLFGDQVMFCRKADFLRVGGFDEDLSIMEDADLCTRMHMNHRVGERGWTALHKRRRIRMVNRTVQTSGRRVVAVGQAKSTYIHFLIAMSWYWGASPERLRSLYDNLYTDIR